MGGHALAGSPHVVEYTLTRASVPQPEFRAVKMVQTRSTSAERVVINLYDPPDIPLKQAWCHFPS